ncbi:hypothetical protein J3A83DRAFT_110903 [Scleroderma citrinum]
MASSTRLPLCSGYLSYAGFQTEDPPAVFVVNTFESEQALAAFQASEALDAVLRKLTGGEVVHRIVKFDEEVESRLRAPITEFVTCTLKEGNTMDQLRPLVLDLHDALKGSAMFHGSSWAPVLNASNTYDGILGWDTVQAHWDAVSGGRPKEIIDRMKELVNLFLVHAALRRLV